MLKLNTESLVKKELFCIFFEESDINDTLIKMLKVVKKERGITKEVNINKEYNFIKLFYNTI